MASDPLAQFFRETRSSGGKSGSKGEEPDTPHLFIVDTNPIVEYDAAVLQLVDGNNALIIPMEVLLELENIKGRLSDEGKVVTIIRDFTRFIGELGPGVGQGGVRFTNPLSGLLGFVRTHVWTPELDRPLDKEQKARLDSLLKLHDRPEGQLKIRIDHRIICLAAYYHDRYHNMAEVVLLTGDGLMRALSWTLAPHVKVEDFRSTLDGRQRNDLLHLNADLLKDPKLVERSKKPLEVFVPPFMVRHLDRRGYALVSQDVQPFLGVKVGKTYVVADMSRPDHKHLANFGVQGGFHCFVTTRPERHQSGRLPRPNGRPVPIRP